MLGVGDVHVYVSDFPLALRFWADGLGLRVVEQESLHAAPFAVLEFPDGGPALRLFGGAEPWPDGQRPPVGSRPTIRFDVTTTEFDETLARVLEYGGACLDEVESYHELRVVTVTDPDGNPFELVELPPGENGQP